MSDVTNEAAIRGALTRVASNVVIITTSTKDGPHGSTATVWSEWIDPPVAVVMIDRDGETFKCISEAGHFAVNLLDENGADVAKRFAEHGVDRFAGVAFHVSESGIPLLEGCVATLECRLDASYPLGSYTIVSGAIVSATTGDVTEPLVYYNGSFRKLGT